MIKYKRVPTTHAVYRAIVSEHTKDKNNYELSVFESYTNIVENGLCTIYTVWGLKGGDVALVGAKTTYEAEDDKEVEHSRIHNYWLCAAYECENL